MPANYLLRVTYADEVWGDTVNEGSRRLSELQSAASQLGGQVEPTSTFFVLEGRTAHVAVRFEGHAAAAAFALHLARRPGTRVDMDAVLSAPELDEAAQRASRLEPQPG